MYSLKRYNREKTNRGNGIYENRLHSSWRKIRDARLNARITQEVLAEKTDLSITHISAIENASTGVSLQALTNIASELRISIDFLVFDSRHSNLVIESEIKNILSDCTDREAQVLLELLKASKEAVKRLK